MSHLLNTSTMTNFVLQPIITNELLPGLFGQTGVDVLQKILHQFNLEDFSVLYFVCRFFRGITSPYLKYTIVHITNASEPEPEFIKFRETNRKFMYPFQCQQIVSVQPEQSLELFRTESPVGAIFTSDGTMPIGIDTSQLRCIASSSKNRIHLGFGSLLLYDIFSFLHHNCEKLPNFVALTISNAEINAEALERCKTNLRLKHLDLAGSKLINDCLNCEDIYPLTSLQDFANTIEHDDSRVSIPKFDNLKKWVIHLPKTNDLIKRPARHMKHFEADRYKLLNHWEVLCDSPTRICHFNFGLPNTDCLCEFNCNATPMQVTFIAYGTQGDDGVFIPGSSIWVSNLNKIMVRKDFQWLVEISKNEFETYSFKDVTLKQGVKPEYYLETGNEPKNAEK